MRKPLLHAALASSLFAACRVVPDAGADPGEAGGARTKAASSEDSQPNEAAQLSSDGPESGADPTSPAGRLSAEDREQLAAAFLDAWHQAASDANLAGYVGVMAADGVFLGTDAGERWTREEFEEYVRPYFERGRGWTYVPGERHVALEGDLAWFDELLSNSGYGALRGTGVLRWRDGDWELVQYDLHFTVPNERAGAVVDLIKGSAQDS